MTEEEWTTCSDPKAMLTFAADCVPLTGRQLRLLACGFCRRFLDGLPLQVVEIAERHADGLASRDEREAALQSALAIRSLSGIAAKWTVVESARTGAIMVADVVGQLSATTGAGYEPSLWEAESQVQCDLVRDLVGPLAFRPISIRSEWKTPRILEIAQGIYDERAFGRMLELGQELHRAGCDERDVLRHCVWDGEHLRGCWVIDLLLGEK